MKNPETHTQVFGISTARDLYDLSMLEEMDDNDYVVELISILLMETPKDLNEMREALSSGKATIVSERAHKLKSSAGIIQAGELCAMLQKIESIGKEGTVTNELKHLVDCAVNQYCRIETALKMHVEELNQLS